MGSLEKSRTRAMNLADELSPANEPTVAQSPKQSPANGLLQVVCRVSNESQHRCVVWTLRLVLLNDQRNQPLPVRMSTTVARKWQWTLLNNRSDSFESAVIRPDRCGGTRPKCKRLHRRRRECGILPSSDLSLRRGTSFMQNYLSDSPKDGCLF